MKRYLLDVGEKVNLLDIKMDIVGALLDVSSDAWEFKKNVTEDIWSNLVESWEAKQDAWASIKNKTKVRAGYNATKKASVWDSIVTKLGYKKNITVGVFNEIVDLAENVVEWKVNKTQDVFEAIADYKVNKTLG
jgi:hypothetical protein